MKLIPVTSNPFVVPVTPDPANYADNKLSVRSSGGAETIVLPLIASLQSNEVDIYVSASGAACTVQTQGSDTFGDGTTSVSVGGSGSLDGTFFTPISGGIWYKK